MSRFRIPIAAVLFAFLLGAASAQTPLFRSFLPSISNGQGGASICDGSAPLSDADVGALSAMRDADGRYIVAIQDRYSGSRARVLRHVGNGLEEIAEPVAIDVLPAFSPNDAKVGALALVPNEPGGKSRLYYVQRAQDATPNDGPYQLWCMEFSS